MILLFVHWAQTIGQAAALTRLTVLCRGRELWLVNLRGGTHIDKALLLFYFTEPWKLYHEHGVCSAPQGDGLAPNWCYNWGHSPLTTGFKSIS